MSRCGRCKGRGVIKPTIGFGDKDCPDCKGTGEKYAARSQLGKRTVSLGEPPRGTKCAFCDKAATHYHHACPQNRLDHIGLSEEDAQLAKADIRNGVPVSYDCHDRVEKGLLHVEDEHLHPQFWAFVVDFDAWPAVPLHLQTDENWERTQGAA